MSTETTTITSPDAPSELAMAQAHAAEVRTELEAQRTLFNAGIIDLDAGLALVKQRLAAASAPHLSAIITELCDSHPALFRAASNPVRTDPPRTDPPRAPSTTLSPSTTPNTRAELEHAADIARTTGSPRSLIDYLRLRRSAAD